MKKLTYLCYRKLLRALTVRIPSFLAPDDAALSADTERESHRQNARWEAMRVPKKLLMPQLSNAKTRVPFLNGRLCTQEASAIKQ